MLVEMAPKIEFHLQDSTIVVRAGKSKLTLKQPGERDGQVVVEAGRTTITMDQDGDVMIDAAGNISLTTSTGDVSIQGMNISVNGQQNVTIEANGDATLNGKIGATVQSTGTATLQGSITAIKGTTTFSP
jgi:hypothetical protein